MRVKPADIAVSLRRAVVAYFDVTGFMTWRQKNAVAARDSSIFIRQMKYEFRRFCKATGLFCIPAGDGLIAVVEASGRVSSADVLDLIHNAQRLIHTFDTVINAMDYPRPGGVRARIAAGAVYRIETPRVDDPRKFETDFIGEPLDKASRLLEVDRGVPIILDESVIAELTPADRRRLNLTALPPRDGSPRNVDPEDMRGLRRCRLGRLPRERRRAPR
jgi:class 3 adenylate cyclase